LPLIYAPRAIASVKRATSSAHKEQIKWGQKGWYGCPTDQEMTMELLPWPAGK